MTSEELKQKIKDKFGTLKRFCDRGGLSIQTVQYELAIAKNSSQALKHIEKVLNSLDPDDSDLTTEIIDRMKFEIDKHGGVMAFCEKNPEFNKISVYQILNGTRKRMSTSVQMLMDRLNVKP